MSALDDDDLTDEVVVGTTAAEARAERLLNLIQVLLAAEAPITREDIRIAVGYDNPTDEAFERSFERDKDELRGMGIPVQTATDASGNVLGYELRAAEARLPDISLSEEESRVLSVAAHAWERATLGSAARQGMAKLEAAGVPFSEPTSLIGADVATDEPTFDVLFRAITARQTVTFEYRTGGRPGTLKRHVEPWSLIAREGHWYLVGHDRDRDNVRVFRLSRIAGKVTVRGATGAYTIPAEVSFREHIYGFTPNGTVFQAIIRIAPDRANTLRRRAIETRADGTHVIEYGDVELFADELCGYGDGVVVIEPPELRAQVIERLRLIIEVHS